MSSVVAPYRVTWVWEGKEYQDKDDLPLPALYPHLRKGRKLKPKRAPALPNEIIGRIIRDAGGGVRTAPPEHKKAMKGIVKMIGDLNDRWREEKHEVEEWDYCDFASGVQIAYEEDDEGFHHAFGMAGRWGELSENADAEHYHNQRNNYLSIIRHIRDNAYYNENRCQWIDGQ